MTNVTFSSKAYCKIILHAAKYPFSAVNGVLLVKASSMKNKVIEFVDAIPLFHVALNLTPMAEIALTQIDQIAGQADLIIGGYYYAHDNFKEKSFDKANHRISEKIAENIGNAFLVIVDNSKLSLNLDNLAMNIAQFHDGKYRPIERPMVALSPSNSLDICTALLNNRAYECLIDFDNHLDDISLDWTNQVLNKKIEYCNDNY